MRRVRLAPAAALLCGAALLWTTAGAQASSRFAPPEEPGGGGGGNGRLYCASRAGDRQHCPADTSRGVVLAASRGASACLLGKTWGYDDAGVWVADGCSGEFVIGEGVGGTTAATAAPSEPAPPAGGGTREIPAERIESWGEFTPGDGFLVGRSSAGELSISAYALVRYVNQDDDDGSFTDHFGNERDVDARQDIFPHRVMVFFKGWLADPKLVYNIFFWTVNTTDQKNIFGSMGYQFNRKISVYGGINGLPGTRSLQGSHPYWLGHDRLMADEFFRPYFTMGLWAQGEIAPGLWYNTMVGNNLSALGIKATQLDRKVSGGASVWWMPTTREFGPRGGFGDWERHEELATRFGASWSFSPEERYTDSAGATGNTTVRLADSLNVFDTGSLAPEVTVSNLDYQLLSIDAGMKYRGWFLQLECYNRWLDDFDSDGALPVDSIHDAGFYLQGSFFPIEKRLETYAATSHVYGDEEAGFEHSWELLGGFNFYPFQTRNHRLNFQLMHVDRSPVSSTFGYYVGGQEGTTVSTAFSIFF